MRADWVIFMKLEAFRMKLSDFQFQKKKKRSPSLNFGRFPVMINRDI